MSTRSCIRIQDSRGVCFVYRHWDGYPSVNGIDLLEVIEKYNTKYGVASLAASDLVRRESASKLISQKKSYDYEITDSWHGDIDWAYQIEFEPGKPAKILVSRCQGIAQKYGRACSLRDLPADLVTEYDINSFNKLCRKSTSSAAR